jgi:nucleoside-diphosphate-sugar epimerase
MLATMLEDIIGRHLEREQVASERPGDAHRVLDTMHARTVLGFKAEITMKEGLMLCLQAAQLI